MWKILKIALNFWKITKFWKKLWTTPQKLAKFIKLIKWRNKYFTVKIQRKWKKNLRQSLRKQ